MGGGVGVELVRLALLSLQPVDLLLRVDDLGVVSSKAPDIAGFCELHVLNSAREVVLPFEGGADVVVRIALATNVTCETKTERFQRISKCCDLIGRHSPVCRAISPHTQPAWPLT